MKRITKAMRLVRLKKLRTLMADVDAKLINMDVNLPWDSAPKCGCAMFHARKKRMPLLHLGAASDYFGLPYHAVTKLFGAHQYRPVTGVPAKREFLKRLDKIIKQAAAS